MFIEIFLKYFVLFYLISAVTFGQAIDNDITIELGQTNFPIERPFTISIIIPNSDSRPSVLFPDIPGFTKKGTSASVTPSEIGGKTITNQVITQNYQARAPGRFRIPPFSIEVNDETVQSEGTIVVVRPSGVASGPVTSTAVTLAIPSSGAAFLSLRASKATLYAGEDVALTLSFFIADNYPYRLQFRALDKQLQTITKKIRPANAWEESVGITELNPVPVLVGGKKFREYRLYQSVFFPLANRTLQLPAVTLWMEKERPIIGPPSAKPETITFTSKPITIAVRPLPAHPLRGRVPVGTFRLEENLERQRVRVGQSIRYTFTVTGEGNIATLPAPATLNDTTAVDIFPPKERHTIENNGTQVTGRKLFTYFIVPHQDGSIPLVNRFQWIYFNPHTARYDTLRPRAQLQVGGKGAGLLANATVQAALSGTTGEVVPATTGNSLYSGIEAIDSTQQSMSVPALIRSIANVLIVIMLLGVIFVFFKK
ncbi:BatD family protein [Spirosoma sp. RP8]|uniref:BatD family protein n=1 Tax=Spirosoma liriopis TaxID=2937440 RepID=A0ABT0HI69_9BACT|nr:BatD family protein [Spirosoma liriopis]MCK8491572.1 BatD family protein [Spirosoma liriopis]